MTRLPKPWFPHAVGILAPLSLGCCGPQYSSGYQWEESGFGFFLT